MKIEWIKCSDGMPSIGFPVLVYVNKITEFNEQSIFTAIWNPDYGGWGCNGCSGYEREEDWDVKAVTHWAYLPDRPKE